MLILLLLSEYLVKHIRERKEIKSILIRINLHQSSINIDDTALKQCLNSKHCVRICSCISILVFI